MRPFHGQAIRFPCRLPAPFRSAKCSRSSSSVGAAVEEQESDIPLFWNPCSLNEIQCTESHLHRNLICRDGRLDYWISQLRCSHALAGEGRLRRARKVLTHMLEKEGPGSAPAVCQLLSNVFCDWNSGNHVWDILANAYARLEMPSDALFVVRRMHALNIHASKSTYDAVLYCLRHVDVVSDLYRDIKASGISSNKITDSILLDALCKQKRLQNALSFFQELRERKDFMPCIVIINSLISGFLEEALEVFGVMERDGVEVDIGLMNDAFKVFNRMIVCGLRPDVVTYTTLISGFCKDGSIKQMETLLDEMESIGLDMDVVAYSVLIHGYCRTGHFDKAFQTCQVIHSKRIIPNSFIHGAFLSSLCKNGMVSEANEYLDRLTRCNLSVNVTLYNRVIDGYVQEGNIDGAVGLYKQMFKRGIMPTTVTCNSLLLGFCKTGQLFVARDFLRNIEIYGVTPTVVTYTTLMDAFSESGDVDAMLELLGEMIGKDITPNVITFSVVIKGLCKKGRINEAVRLLKEVSDMGIHVDEIAYNTLIQGFCEVSEFKMAFCMLKKMFLTNVSPTPVTYSLLINALCLKGNLEGAELYLNDLVDKGVCLRKFAYITIIKAQCAKGMQQKAILLFERMLRADYDVSIKDYSAVINRLCKRNCITEAVLIFNMMLCTGILPDQELSCVMCDALLKNYYHRSVFTLQAMMTKLCLAYDNDQESWVNVQGNLMFK
ncbi:hypothetical protein HPP92_001379 [Vanilla planifolia]|uniref:Pentatricopeptide repeat-containing protein n=1 Tax=Vanilla planifolia TaxID=51239 RepID=A0A835VGW2_VANPL|nr:hypothetical protein HPP92_001379 [Vanilla planifolia]